jgi:hypothetical protein
LSIFSPDHAMGVAHGTALPTSAGDLYGAVAWGRQENCPGGAQGACVAKAHRDTSPLREEPLPRSSRTRETLARDRATGGSISPRTPILEGVVLEQPAGDVLHLLLARGREGVCTHPKRELLAKAISQLEAWGFAKFEPTNVGGTYRYVVTALGVAAERWGWAECLG